MGEFLLFLVIFVGIMTVSALIFGGWFIVMIVRGIAGFFGMRHDVPPIEAPRASGAVRVGPVMHRGAVGGAALCGNPLCRAPNGTNARFCRRCGQKMAHGQAVNVRRAAVW
jgi:hypothetical protein